MRDGTPQTLDVGGTPGFRCGGRPKLYMWGTPQALDVGNSSLALDVGVHPGLCTWGGTQGSGREGGTLTQSWGHRLRVGRLGINGNMDRFLAAWAQRLKLSNPVPQQHRVPRPLPLGCSHQGPPAASLAGSLSLYEWP